MVPSSMSFYLYHPSSLLEVCGFLVFGNTKCLYIMYIIIKHNGIQFTQSLKIIQTFQTAQKDLGLWKGRCGTHPGRTHTVSLPMSN